MIGKQFFIKNNKNSPETHLLGQRIVCRGQTPRLTQLEGKKPDEAHCSAPNAPMVPHLGW